MSHPASLVVAPSSADPLNGSVTPALPSPTYTISYDPSTLSIRLYLNDELVRTENGFGGTPSQGVDGHAEREGEVWVGIMASSPGGEGVEASFKDLEMREGVREFV
jgi:regulation of enolase protein 1 (concanavalin A-like superfamily)